MTDHQANFQQLGQQWQIIWTLVQRAGGEVRIPMQERNIPVGAAIHTTVDPSTDELVIKSSLTIDV